MASEEIIEVEELNKKPHIEATASSSSSSETNSRSIITTSSSAPKFLKPSFSIGGSSNNQKNSLKNLVKLKPAIATKTSTATKVAVATPIASATSSTSVPVVKAQPPTNALSLLSGYDDDSNDSNQSD